MTTGAQPMQIDESLYSRQLYVLGHDAMRRMAEVRFLPKLGDQSMEEARAGESKGGVAKEQDEVMARMCVWARNSSEFWNGAFRRATSFS